ncbi:MBOAT family O-acyltransferase [Aliarcobacter butzleri]|uniref:MBOAT family O-acyltransferase n=1 Tax=Aliarcobacter butzleri TaxID=28197 RepID=UPI003AF8237E
MIFSTLPFLYFFIVYTIVWFLSPERFRIGIIIIFSIFFYGYWNWNYIILPVILTFMTFLCTNYLMSNKQRMNKRNLIIIVILISLPLIYFKYFNFIFNIKLVDFPIPLGISFITFTLIAYIVDVYKNVIPKENKFSILFAYIMYYPQLIAGPILRPQELIPQLKNISKATSKMKIAAITIFSIGLSKKILFADQLSFYVDSVYIEPLKGTFLQWIVAFYAFPVQLYCDFSGYTDMAIGLALFFGIVLPLNFNKPYLSTSISDFWRNWHISLSSWIRDYAYFPLGNIVKNMYIRTLIVMTLVGLWHGASWTMVIFGFIHGILVSFSNFFRLNKIHNFLPNVVKIILTFHIICFTLIFFRATDINNVMDMFSAMKFIDTLNFNDLHLFLYPVILIGIFFLTHKYDNIKEIEIFVGKIKIIYLSLFIVFIWLLSIIVSIMNSGSNKFIYFDF